MKKGALFLVVVILLFLGCTTSSPEKEDIDVFNEVTKLQALTKKMSEADDKRIDSTLFYVEKIQKIIDDFERLPDTFLIENLFRKGYYYKQIAVKDSATIYFHKVIDLVKKPNNRSRNLTYFWNAWVLEEDNVRMSNAIDIAEKFVEISDDKENAADLVYAFNFLERAYRDLENYEKALYYNSKGLEAANVSGNMDMYIITGTSKAKLLHKYVNKKEEAFKFLDSLRVVKTENKDVYRQYVRQYGTLNSSDGNYKEAIKYFDTVIRITKETEITTKAIQLKNDYDLLEAYTNISEAYLEVKDYKKTEQYLDSAKTVINSKSFPDYVRFYKELRFKLNYRGGNSEDSILKEYNVLVKQQNKLHREKIDEELVSLKLANEKEKIATTEKNEAKLRNIKLLTLSGFLILILIIGYLFYRQRRYKFEKQDLQMQQRLLRSQMNPHFIFNTLSAIQNQIKENKEDAINYLLKFSRLLRLVLENSLNNYVQIENELESLLKYMDLQLLRFPNKFSYNLNLENFEEDELLFIPPMLIQPFIENSIEHGFLGIDYKGRIDIKLELKDNFIACSIEDNGVGLKGVNKMYKKSISTQLISKFIYKTTKTKVFILDKKIEDLSETGVLVELLIPYKFSEND